MKAPWHIVGQGIAGTALAWRCHLRGQPFRLYDQPRAETASKVSAGIVTPIAGQRLTLTQGWAFLDEMEAFYAEIGQVLGDTFYERHPTVRFLINETELARWQKRLGDPLYLAETESRHELSPHFTPSHGCFCMRRSGFLRVAAWLAHSRRWFLKNGLLAESQVHPDACSPDDGLWIFANGPWLLGLPPFDWLPMRYAHGDILTLAIPDLGNDRHLYNGECWLQPIGEGYWRTGATYEARPTPETKPSVDGRGELESRLRAFLKAPYTVEDHVAAVRPVTLTRFPTMGRHPSKPHLAWFGGFSSKGVLTSPTYARHFMDHLLDDKPLPSEVDCLH